MEILIGIVLVLFIILIVKITRKEKDISLKNLVKKTFINYKIIEKHGTIMICEITHRNEPNELVFIRINSNKKKNIKKSGRIIVADYPKNPTAKEMKADFKGYL